MAGSSPASQGDLLRVLHINTERSFRGGERQALYLARGLALRGVDVLVVGQPGRPFARRCEEAGIPVTGIPMRGEVDPLAVSRLMGLIRRTRPDIVHMHTSHAHTLGVLAARGAGRGRTVVSRRVAFSIHRNRFRTNLVKYRFGVDRYIAISGGVRDVLVGDGVPSERIDVVPSGVDLEELSRVPRRDFSDEFRIPPSAPVVGNVAHFGWDKAQEILVEACPYLWRERPDTRILLVGDGERRGRVEEIARSMGSDERLLFTGHREDARELIRWFTVFAISSVMEGLCTSILDAHMLGTPVVATRVGGIPEAIRDGKSGLLVPPREPEALAGATLRLLSDPELRRELNRAGRELTERRFGVDAMVEGTLSVYRKVLSASKR